MDYEVPIMLINVYLSSSSCPETEYDAELSRLSALCRRSNYLVIVLGIIFGPSGVRALPLAAGLNVVAIVLGIIFLLLSSLFF